MNSAGLFVVGAGLFSLAGAVCDWDRFRNARKPRFLVALLTRTGARAFYGLLGAGLVILGIMPLLGAVEVSK